ncbi:MAG: hypothetical protein WC683_17290 [bacterium]
MAGPWERFQAAPASTAPAEGPWSRFAPPPAEPPPASIEQASEPAPAAEPPSIIGDIVKTAPAALARGAIGVVASPFDIPAAINQGLHWIGRKVGLESDGLMPAGTAELLNALRGGKNPNAPPDYLAPKIQKAIESVTGPFHESQTTPGKFVGAALEAVPSAMLAPGNMMGNAIRYGVIPGLSGEAASQIAPDMPAARLAGTLAGVVGGNAIANLPGRIISPMAISDERRSLVDTLTKEGVPLTAGQKTGSKSLRYLESHLGDLPGSGGKAAALDEAQREAFTRAALKRAGIDAARATPDTMAAGYDDLGQRFGDLSARNTLKMDSPLAQALVDAEREYNNLTTQATRAPIVSKLVDDLLGKAIGGGAIPGETYQNMRSQIGKTAETFRMADPARAEALRNIRGALDEAMTRSISPEDVGAWAQLRRKYVNYKALEKAAAGAGENAAQGYISPASLRAAISAGNKRGGYVRGEGDLADLARAGVGVMSPLPNSGTPARLASQSMLSAPGAVAGSLMGGAPGAAFGAAAAPFAPGLAGRALMSGPVQAYLSNQLAPDLGLISQLDPAARRLAAALALRSNISAPGAE